MLKSNHSVRCVKNSPLQMNILRQLKYCSLTLTEIADILDRRRGNVSKSIRRMVYLGYVKRSGLEYNRTHKITSDGLEVLKDIDMVELESVPDKKVPKREWRCVHYYACMRILTQTNRNSPRCDTCDYCQLLPREEYLK